MSDQGFHEIQLTGKQLVFLFMAAVVLAVSIFLLGVSVGRGVRSSVGTAADLGAPSDTTASASTPPATNVTPADLDYRQKLQSTPSTGAAAAGAISGAAAAAAASSAATKPVEPPQPPPELPADAGKKPDLTAMANDPNAAKTTTPKPTPAPAKPTPTPVKPTPTPSKPAAASTSKPSAPPAEAGWSVQLNAFKTQGAADSFIKELKGKGYTAYSVPSATLFKVLVGPFSNRADADKMASRLKKDGYTPLITR